MDDNNEQMRFGSKEAYLASDPEFRLTRGHADYFIDGAGGMEGFRVIDKGHDGIKEVRIRASQIRSWLAGEKVDNEFKCHLVECLTQEMANHTSYAMHDLEDRMEYPDTTQLVAENLVAIGLVAEELGEISREGGELANRVYEQKGGSLDYREGVSDQEREKGSYSKFMFEHVERISAVTEKLIPAVVAMGKVSEGSVKVVVGAVGELRDESKFEALKNPNKPW